MKHKLFFVLVLTLGSVIFSACSNKKTIKKINPEFAKYVSGYTAGMISRQQNIVIELADQYGNPGGKDSTKNFFDIPDSTVLEDIFSFSPNIKGKARWKNRRVIEFIPSEPFKSDQFYDVVFNLEKVADVKKGFEAFEFQFASYPQKINIDINGLRTYNDYNTEWMKITGVVNTSDFAEREKVEKTIKATLNGNNLKVRWTESYSDNEYRFVVDSIHKSGTRGTVKISWDGSEIGSIDKGEQTYEVPSFGDFTVSEVKVADDKDQVVELYFTDPLLWKQNLDGIITIEGVEKLNYTIEGNMVKVYIDTRIKGNRQLNVHTGVKNHKAYNMNESYETTIEFEAPKPRVKLLGNGSILPNSGGLIFPFEAVALKKVDVRVIKISQTDVHQFLQVNNMDGNDELSRIGSIIAEKTLDLTYDANKNLETWNTHVIDLGNLIKPEPGAIYRIGIKFKKEYAICECEESNENDNYTPWWDKSHNSEWSEEDWNSYAFDDGYEPWYYYEENASPCEKSYYKSRAISKNILASDIGMIYKLDEDKTSHAFITNMITTEPIPNCQIEYFDYSKKLVGKGMTDENGMLDLPLMKKPFLMIASHVNQKGYLKLGEGYANSISRFEVEGANIQKGIKGFIYGERGVWRPGDSIYLSFILEDKDKKLPTGFPVKFELVNPGGSVVNTIIRNESVNGIYNFNTSTTADAMTGNYTATVSVGNSIFTKSVKIETIKPNRLKIYLNVFNDKIDESGKDTIGNLEVKWLHGAVAANLQANVAVQFKKSQTEFKGYVKYEFDSPIREYNSEEIAVFNGRVDANGKAAVLRNFQGMKQAAGVLKANFVTRVYEEGGDFSIDRYSVPFYPFKDYVGIRIPETKNYNGNLETGKTYKIDLATVNSNGKGISKENLRLKIYKLRRYWWYEEEEALSDFVSRGSAVQILDSVLFTKDGKGSFNVNFQNEDYGKYLVTVTDEVGGHQTGKIINVDWPYWQRGNTSGNENARMLNFTADKTSYTTGEKIKLSIPSQSGGRALISVENRSKVVQKFWVNTTDKETKCEVLVTPEMTPNVYIHVTFVQPHSNTKNDLPIRMYGIVPITVVDPNTVLHPVLLCDAVWKPETTEYVTVSESSGKAMSYTLAVVDDGLLDLTRFTTPDPWNSFYAKEALGVKTWDMYDHVIGAFAGKIDKLLSIGGDGGAIDPEGAKANRFKPMVRFIGPFYLAAGKSAKHKIEIPNYVGSVRVMVVSANSASYGNAEKTVEVKKPLMVLPTLPRVIGPGETVALPVNVFAMEKHVKDVSVRIEVSDNLSIIGESKKEMHFTRIGDEVVNFNLEVSKKIGIASVKVIAVSGSEKTEQTIEIDIRPSNPKVTESYEWTLAPGKSLSKDIIYEGIQGTNQVAMEISTMPSIGLNTRLDYLIQYPHGCIEQTTSSVFPQLYVSNLIKLNTDQKSEISVNIKAALKRLQKFQTGAGGFAYWPGESESSEWGSNYAGHFMLEAEQMGYVLPGNLKKRWIKYQTESAKNWYNSNTKFEHYTQAYRLYVLALAKSPELGSMNRLRESKNLDVATKWQLAAAYKLIGQNDAAMQMIKGLDLKVSPYTELSYTYGSDFRDRAMILEALGVLNIKNERSDELLVSISKTMNSKEWLSTQEAAYGLMSICRYVGAGTNTDQSNQFTYKVNGSSKTGTINGKGIYQLKYNEKSLTDKSVVAITNNSNSTLYIKIMKEGIPLIGDKKSSNNIIQMTVTYMDMKGKPISVNKLQQGFDFMAEVTITNNGKRGYLKEMALNQIFPSGWEIRNSRMDGFESSTQARYTDIRDDRVYSYYELGEGETKKFVVRLNATFIGKFYLPTLYSEAMYDNTIHARIPGTWVEVIKPTAEL
ncbi:MAG TPA: MG2 domain-containing protein [Bacteroidia bacterium]